ncbi:hypothetical protein, partial [Klebsiella michiganensis]|uniref:hypothetical protein n=1 Tax=Klebsiella michiganensis TaxID=1134687 RepID=UPI001CA3250E
KDGLGRHIGSCGPLNRNFLRLLIIAFLQHSRYIHPFPYGKHQKRHNNITGMNLMKIPKDRDLLPVD